MISTNRFLGICMDHQRANLMELQNDEISLTNILSVAGDHMKEETLKRSEKEGHNRENRNEQAYYKAIGKAISGHDNVLLFGPTEAKTELFNILRRDHGYDHIRIDLETSDKMTGPQEQAFVRHHFARPKF